MQEIFISCPNRIKMAFCGNRSGKTMAALLFELIHQCMGIHPLQKKGIYRMPPIKARIIEPTLTTGIDKFVIPLMQELMGKDWYAGKYDVKEHRYVFPVTGSELDFMSSDQEIDQFGSVDKDLIVIDEPTRQDIWNECLMRILMTHGRIVFTMTPIAENSNVNWIFRELYTKAKKYGEHCPDDMVKFQWGITDNVGMDGKCRVTEKEITSLTSGMTPEQKKIVLYGDFIQLTGLILPWLDEHNYISRSEVPGDLVYYEVIDWHPRKDIYALWLGIDKNGDMYVTDHIIARGSIRDIALAIIRKREGKAIVRSCIDWLSNMGTRGVDEYDGNSPRTILNRDYGIFTKNVKKDNQFKVRLVQEALAYNPQLKRSRMRIVNDQGPVIEQLKMWHWREFKSESNEKQQPVKKDDDFCDALGYALLEKPDYQAYDNSRLIPIRDPNDVLGCNIRYVESTEDANNEWEMTKTGFARK